VTRPRALVTGATGLVGSHVVARLREEGWMVRAMARDPDAAAWLDPLGCSERVRGDVLDGHTFAAAAAGCDVIVHAAAAITPRGGWEAFHSTNVVGTTNAIDAAASAMARLVHVSSVAVYGGSTRYRADGRLTDESVALAALPPGAFYARSKRESEALALDAHRRGRIWATAIRPCVVYGRRDRQFVPRVARAVRVGVHPLLGGGRSTLAIVHAASVADAIFRAAIRDAAGGNAYNAANDPPVTVFDFVRLATEGLGRPFRPVGVPLAPARAAIAALAGLARLGGRVALGAMIGSSIDFLTRDNPFTSERARGELGWATPVAPAEGVPDAFRSLGAAHAS
jgi:nucleoside-diphosphate-sugar epimerase